MSPVSSVTSLDLQLLTAHKYTELYLVVDDILQMLKLWLGNTFFLYSDAGFDKKVII